ncbi:MAG: hypothetical protein NZ561_05095, partial [Phycisphaerae bacterium]|nr:hypothetical protein [Phycisphaerae bacterium]
GLAERATYAASRPTYGKDRPHEAIIFTNKEQHDPGTLTKAERSNRTIEVFKHNHIEVVPTPNYEYKFVTTSHLAVDDLSLTRLDCSSQEFCGTSFKQFLRVEDGRYDYFAFSYMPETGRRTGIIGQRGMRLVAEDALPLWLRDLDFQSRSPVRFWLIPSQKSNRPTPYLPIPAEARITGVDGDSYKVEVLIGEVPDSPGESVPPMRLLGTFWMARDRLHVMTRAVMADGRTYQLTSLARVNYWTITGE